MTIHLPEDLEESIRAEVLSGRYASEDAMIAEIVREHLRQQIPPPSARLDEPEVDPVQPKPLWQQIAELRESVPDEEWDKLPVDGAEQLDHYIYGSPKRPQR